MESMDTIDYAQWLRTQFTLHPDKSKSDLARALGLEPPAISKILNGTRQVKAHEYAIMRQFFGLPTDGEHALQPQAAQTRNTNPSQLHDASNNQGGQWDMPSWAHPSDNNKTTSPHTTTLIVSDRMMEPEFMRDETVVIDMRERTPSPAGAFAISDRFSQMIRHCELTSDSSPQTIKVSAHSDAFEPQTLTLDEFEIIGRVVGKVDWL